MKVLIKTAKLCLFAVAALGLGQSITWADNGFTLEAGDIVVEDGKIQTNKICDKDGNNCKDISNISSSHTHPYSSNTHTHPYSSSTHGHQHTSCQWKVVLTHGAVACDQGQFVTAVCMTNKNSGCPNGVASGDDSTWVVAGAIRCCTAN